MSYYDILVYSVYSDLRTEVSRRFFGFLWWILEPLMYMATFYLVFGVALGQGDEHFAAFLLAGMVIWKWFDGSVRLASTSICNAYGLSQQIHLPKVIYVLIPLLSNTFKFVIIFMLLIGFLIVSKSLRTEALWSLIPVLLCQFYFTFCLSVFFAALLPFFQDLRQVIDNFMLMLMFMSGVFYRTSAIGGKLSSLFQYNPAFLLVDAFRQVLLHGAVPDWSSMFYVLLAGFPLGAVGLLIMIRKDRHYPKILV